jgi:hypothetical protein
MSYYDSTEGINITPELEEQIYGTNAITVLNADSPRIEQPRDFKVDLKAHQLCIINYCKYLENTYSNPIKVDLPNEYGYEIKTKQGIIGDIVGSGKTLSILGLIDTTKDQSLNIPEFNMNRDIVSCNHFIKCTNYPEYIKPELNITLVVVPHTIFKQWQQTVTNQTNLKCLCVNTSKNLEKLSQLKKKDFDSLERYSSLTESVENYSNFWYGEGLEKYDLVLISSTFYNKFVNTVDSFKFKYKRVVFDEADSIKISGAYLLENSFCWFVTSTYGTLLNPNGVIIYQDTEGNTSFNYSYQNGFVYRKRFRGMSNRGFIKSSVVSMDIDKKFKKYFIVKNDNEFINSAFLLEPPIEHVLKCKMPLSLRVLANSVSNEILAFINAGDIQGAVESLDCNKVSESGLIDAVTKDLKSQLNNKIIELEMKSKMSWNNENTKKVALDRINDKIKELNGKIQSIKEKLDDSSHCNICFDVEITCPAITPCCNTKFCFECITKWIEGNNGYKKNFSCPFCRASLTSNDLIIVDDNLAKKQDSSSASKKLEEELDKLQTLKKILEEKFNGESSTKMLIFTDYFRTFDKMTEILDSVGIRYSKVVGTTNTINKKIREYKETGDNSIDCLLLNAEFCASGLNLENTTDIVMMHKMTNEKTTQIIGRGQRPGRQGRLNVWKLFYQTEV